MRTQLLLTTSRHSPQQGWRLVIHITQMHPHEIGIHAEIAAHPDLVVPALDKVTATPQTSNRTVMGAQKSVYEVPQSNYGAHSRTFKTSAAFILALTDHYSLLFNSPYLFVTYYTTALHISRRYTHTTLSLFIPNLLSCTTYIVIPPTCTDSVTNLYSQLLFVSSTHSVSNLNFT